MGSISKSKFPDAEPNPAHQNRNELWPRFRLVLVYSMWYVDGRYLGNNFFFDHVIFATNNDIVFLFFFIISDYISPKDGMWPHLKHSIIKKTHTKKTSCSLRFQINLKKTLIMTFVKLKFSLSAKYNFPCNFLCHNFCELFFWRQWVWNYTFTCHVGEMFSVHFWRSRILVFAVFQSSHLKLL